ncbi:MAG: hypothetical protein P4M11_15730, partial [Candidatus Pacebacteria bacterium]|nr:hypothetical protein [Candidatus Paceibacterota bacterium]
MQHLCFSPAEKLLEILIPFLRILRVLDLLVVGPIVKNHFIFEKLMCRTATIFVAVTGSVALLYVGQYRVPAEGILMSQADIQSNLKRAVAILANCVLSEMYFDKVRDDVHDEVQKYSDQVQKATEDKEAFFATMSH